MVEVLEGKEKILVSATTAIFRDNEGCIKVVPSAFRPANGFVREVVS